MSDYAKPRIVNGGKTMVEGGDGDSAYGVRRRGMPRLATQRYPTSILYFPLGDRSLIEHPTQKPVALYEYLIRTYTNEGDTVLDFCFGSCTTGVAAKRTGRNFIGIEKDDKYFEIGKARMEAEE
jgi:DNA modification methylase